MVDLHTHSNESDGEQTPTELIDMAAEIGLKAIALTDHDTVRGIEEARAHAARKGIRFIPGVELDVDFEPGELHLLGLNLKLDKLTHIEGFLEDIRHRRMTRNRKIIQHMQDDKLDISLGAMKDLAAGEVLGRMHFAHWLVGSNRAKDIPDAFAKWLSPGQPYHVRKSLPALREAIEAVHQSGGKAVLAHPKSLRISWGRLETLIIEWKDMGLDGIEALHSGASMNAAKRLMGLADSHGLFITGGSDYHGANRPDRRLGSGPSGMLLGEELLAAFDNE